mgnify:FL=1|tara:strand:+ start:542 stop:766 length:225 start_codon:yes stop_codon:yes gene_type:complete
MKQMRKIQIKVTRTEVWFPVYEVPDDMTNEDAEGWINAEAPEEVFDEYYNKYTLDTDTYTFAEVIGSVETMREY